MSKLFHVAPLLAMALSGILSADAAAPKLRQNGVDPIPRQSVIWISDKQGREIIAITPDGDVWWRGRKVKTDVEFRKAMLEMTERLDLACVKAAR